MLFRLPCFPELELNAQAPLPTGTSQQTEIPNPVASFATVTTDTSTLVFSAVQKGTATRKRLSLTISGVSTTAETKLTTPALFHFEDASGTATSNEVSVIGNGLFVIFVQFEGGPDVGSFGGDLRISGAETGTTIVELSGVVTPNPSVFPSALAFNAVEGLPSAVQELTLTVSDVSAEAKTIVAAPDFYQILLSATGKTAKIITFTGSGVFTFFARFSGGDVGTFAANITVSGTETETKTIPVRTTVGPIPTPVVNPASLTGFTATEGGAASAAQPFDISVKSLPTQGKTVITVTAPKGYSVALAATSSFVGALVMFATNGSISQRIFARLNSNNPLGEVSGNISITGNEILTQNIPVNGQITPKPLPVLTVDAASLNPYSTITNKPSAAQSYLLKAANLPQAAAVTVKPPAGYEVSLTNASGSIFSSQLAIHQTNGAINATVFVRLKSQNTPGNLSGVVLNSVAGLTKDVSVSGAVVTPPVITLNPTSLAGFTAVKTQASASKSYTLAASNLAAGVTATVKAPVNYELRVQGVGAFADSITLAQTATASINRVLEVRIKATAATGAVSGVIQHAISGVTRNLSVSGAVALPTLATSVSTLTFTTVKDQASSAKSYRVTATNLAAGAEATAIASAGYELGLTSTGVFAPSLSLPRDGVNGVNTDVFVRLKATTATGTIVGTILHTAAGQTKIVTLSTAVAAPTMSVSPASLAGFSALQNQPSLAKTYTFTATGLATDVNALVTAPAGYELSVQGISVFSSTLTLAQTSAGTISRVVVVRLKADAIIGSKAGSIINAVSGLTRNVAVTGIVNPISGLSGRADLQSELRAELEAYKDDSPG